MATCVVPVVLKRNNTYYREKQLMLQVECVFIYMQPNCVILIVASAIKKKMCYPLVHAGLAPDSGSVALALHQNLLFGG